MIFCLQSSDLESLSLVIGYTNTDTAKPKEVRYIFKPESDSHLRLIKSKEEKNDS